MCILLICSTHIPQSSATTLAALAAALLGIVVQDYNLLLLHKETHVPGGWRNLLPTSEVTVVTAVCLRVTIRRYIGGCMLDMVVFIACVDLVCKLASACVCVC